MPIGNPVTLTSNVASKAISVTATASQTLFNVTGGYRINELGVFKNGLRLQDGVDYTARDGLTVTLLSAASGGDKLQFVVFDTFRVAEAIRPAVDEQTIRGNLNVVGILSCTDLEGPVSLNITSGIQTFHDVRVGGALTVAGTLTYEDTTNTNTTGIATFSGGMNISGIGATATTLNVTGFSTFSDNVSIGDSIFHTGDTDTAIRFPAADTFTVETGGDERFRITSAGRLGIKTDTPAAPLHVDSDNAYGSFVLSRDGGVSGRRPFGFGISGATDANFRISASSNTLGANAFDNQIIDITAAGNVGIGSLIPAYMLDIASTNASMRINSTSTSTLVITSGSGQSARIEFGDLANNDTGYIYYDNSDDSMQFATNGSNERLRIASNGKVGIGSEIPTEILDVSGSGDMKMVVQTRDSGAGNNAGIRIATGDGYKWISQVGDATTSGGLRIYEETSGSSGERLRIASGGNVGLSVVPETWSTNFRALQIARQACVTGQTGANIVEVSANAYHNSGWKYIQTDTATKYYQYQGEHVFESAASGSADAAITFNERMKINSSGDVNIAGITTATQLFEGTTRVASTGKAIAMAMLFG